ncbi:MAG: cobaltochelatase subunit CobN [Xylophilus ampelinus]
MSGPDAPDAPDAGPAGGAATAAAGAAGVAGAAHAAAGRPRGLSILAEDDDDPMLSAVNLVDVFLVLVVALLTAVATQSRAGGEATAIRHAGRPDMEITVREQGREIRFKGTGSAAEGGGVRAGVAYRLPDGNIVYVPEAGAPPAGTGPSAPSAGPDASAPPAGPGVAAPARPAGGRPMSRRAPMGAGPRAPAAARGGALCRAAAALLCGLALAVAPAAGTEEPAPPGRLGPDSPTVHAARAGQPARGAQASQGARADQASRAARAADAAEAAPPAGTGAGGPADRPAGLLWITGDVTPATRTALVARSAADAGLAFRHLDYPIQGPSALDAAQAAALDCALAEAGMVWVDAPHPSIGTRLRALAGPRLDAWAARHPGRLVWADPAPRPGASGAPGDPGASAAPGGADAAPAAGRIAAYLQAGGADNLRHAAALARAAVDGRPAPALPPPAPWPAQGLYHPDAPGLLADASAMAAWQRTRPALRGLPAVAVLVHRHHFVDGSTAWLDRWLRRFADQGLFAYAAFGQQVDAARLAGLLEADDGAGGRRLHARVLVLHQLVPQAAALQPLFLRWGAPLLATQPYRPGGAAGWESAEDGLPLADVPFYLAQPEGAGATDPVVVVAQADGGRRPELIDRQADAVVGRARRLVALQATPAVDKRLVAMVYNYPPGGSNFGASFLNVPRSLEVVSGRLADAGYAVRALPEADWIAGLQPLLAAYYPGADLRGLLERGQAEALPLARYEALRARLPVAVRERMDAHWGPPERSRWVVEWQGAPAFVIPRLRAGNLAVLPQPPREETLRAGQSPFMHRSKAPLSHHYLATYLWAGQADALIHFGTHGTQEWAPGKSRGLDVHDDAMLPLAEAADHVPVAYPYIVDNLGEALTAKRRGRATLVSHRTPVFSPAGFASRMARMHELMHEWETVGAGPVRQALEKNLAAQFVEHQLHRDLDWSAERIAADFEGFLEVLHPYLDRLAQSSQPQGLAVFGRAPAPELRRKTILQALRRPLIEALGEDIDEAFLIDHAAVADARPARWLEVALRDADAAGALDLRPPPPGAAAAPAGPAASGDAVVRAADFVPNRAARRPIDALALRALALRAQALDALLATEGEMPGLLAALDGRFLEAAYGGDPIRNPDSLPTGRNLTGLDPARLPTRQAYAVAQTVFDDWLKAWRAEHGGAMPQRLALSLWAGETLRHQGILEAQALVALGVRPRWDDSGRPVGVQAVPLAELGRPRVDVLLSVTGSYRDQFPALMALVDRAVDAAAQAEPGNAVARNTAQVAAELRRAGLPAAQADRLAAVRAFGNAPGDYGTGIAEAVQDDGLRREDERLGRLFLQRMSQPYLGGEPVAGVAPGAAAEALGAHLRRADAAVMARSSHLYAMVSSDDPFQYLGGLAAAARSAGRQAPLGLYVSQLQDGDEPATESARRAIALEMQSRYLHPGWLQAQKAEGYAGTLQVLKAVQFAWGWQSVDRDAVRSDHWQSFYEALVQDRHRIGTREWLGSHPQAFAQTLERLVQAVRQGHWQADAATREDLARRYRELTAAAPLAAELPGVRRWAEQGGPAPEAGAAEPPRADAGARVALARPQAAVAPVRPALPARAVPPSPPARAADPDAAVPPAAPRPPVGVLLERQPDPAAPDALPPQLAAMLRILAFLAMALCAAGGAAWQARAGRRVPPGPGRAAA